MYHHYKSYIGCGSLDETNKLFVIRNTLYHKSGRTGSNLVETVPEMFLELWKIPP